MRTTPVPGLYPRVSKLEELGGSWSVWVSNASSGNSMLAAAERMGLVWRPALSPGPGWHAWRTGAPSCFW